MTEFNFTQPSFARLKGFEANHEKFWYDEHRKDFAAYRRRQFGPVFELATELLAEAHIP